MGITPTALDAFLRDGQTKQENQNFVWQGRYGWLFEEYKNHQNACMKVHEEYATAHAPKPKKDGRTLGPRPNSENHMYGWLVDRPEFKLENRGLTTHLRIPLLPADYI